MSNSSAQQTYSITLDDTLNDTITLNSYTGCGSTITIDTSCHTISYPSYSIGAGISTLSTAQISAITTANINAGSFTWTEPIEWVDKFPDWGRVSDMCKQYPGLAIAFEKFKTTYKLVKDDYDTPKNKRPKP